MVYTLNLCASTDRRGLSKYSVAMPNSDTTQVKSLARGLNILLTLAQHPHGMALAEVARAVDLAPSTVHRLLQTLQVNRFVQESATGQWQVGVASFEIGSAFFVARDWVGDLHSALVELSQMGETSNLGTLDGAEVIFIGQVECQEVMRMVAPLGSRAPAWASGVGKAILATLSPEQRREALPSELGPAFTPSSLTRHEDLDADLEAAKARGFVLDMEERNPGLRCVASPVFDEFGQAPVAISLSGPAARMAGERLEQLGQAVHAQAYQRTMELGGQWPSDWARPATDS